MVDSNDRHAYMEAGYQYARTKTVNNDAPQFVHSFVKEIHSNRNCLSNIVHVSNCYMHAPLSIFIIYGIIDDILMKDMRANASNLVTCDGLFDLFMATFDVVDDRDVEHFVCGLVTNVIDPFASKASPTCRIYVLRLLKLMERISLVPGACDMMRCSRLFESLFHCPLDDYLFSLLLSVITNAQFYHDTRLTNPILQRVLIRLSSSWANVDSGQLGVSLTFAELCFRENRMFREQMVHEMVDMWRTGWRFKLSKILTYQLDTPSVEFLVRLQHKEQLDSLICTCKNNVNSTDWRSVQYHLRRHWPGRVCKILEITNEETDIVPVFAECPITCERIRHPVVASDGHTYERDALLQHLVVNGAWSPMTRDVLSYHLYPNRALYGF